MAYRPVFSRPPLQPELFLDRNARCHLPVISLANTARHLQRYQPNGGLMWSQSDGRSSTVRLEPEGRAPFTLTIRYLGLSRVVLEGSSEGWEHNQRVVAQFNFIVDGQVRFLRLAVRIRLDRGHGIALEFARDSALRPLITRLLKAPRYESPCHFLAMQRTPATASRPA